MQDLERQLSTLVEKIGTLLRERDWHLATAESCTGGLIGHLITSVSGSSDYYWGGVISYANSVKAELLGVPQETLRQHGAVSAPVAGAMARGALDLLHTEIAVSVTGIAGPTGGTLEKPVGTTFIGVATAKSVSVEGHRWQADRSTNKILSAKAALELVRETLRCEREAQASG